MVGVTRLDPNFQQAFERRGFFSGGASDLSGSGKPAPLTLIGPVSLCTRQLRAWEEKTQRVSLVLSGPTRDHLAGAWCRSLAERTDVRDAAIRFLANRLGKTPADMNGTIENSGGPELEALMQQADLTEGLTPEGFCRVVLRAILRKRALTAAGWRVWAQQPAVWTACPLTGLISASLSVLGHDHAPAILFHTDDRQPGVGTEDVTETEPITEAADRLDRFIEWFLPLLGNCSGLIAFLTVSEPTWNRFRETHSDDDYRVATLLEESVSLTGLSREEIDRRLKPVADLSPKQRTKLSEQLTGLGADDDLLTRWFTVRDELRQRRETPENIPDETLTNEQLFAAESDEPGQSGERDSVGQPSGEPGLCSEARSLPEAFLFDLLDRQPDLAGLFALNVTPGFRFRGRRAEIDLCCEPLKIAIELDGWHHFQDPEAFRRDREKDWVLQREGYLVLRFLADDVVSTRMGDILERVRIAVRHRTGTGETPFD